VKTECQNCGREAEEEELLPLEEVRHLLERVAPGEPMPAGECRSCGALAQPVST